MRNHIHKRSPWPFIILGIITGPPLAVCVAIIILSFVDERPIGDLCFLLLFFALALSFIIIVIIKATIIRAVTELSNPAAYSLSLLLIIITLTVFVFCIILTEFIYFTLSPFYIPVFIVVLGIAYRFKAGPNPFDGLYVIVTVLISIFIEGHLFVESEYPNFLPFMPHRLENILFMVPLFFLVPLIEVWLMGLFLPHRKSEKAIIISNIAIIFIIANTYFFTSIALSSLLT